MENNIPVYQLSIRLLGAVLEEDMVHELPTSRLGCFVSYNGELKDALMIKEGAHTVKSD